MRKLELSYVWIEIAMKKIPGSTASEMSICSTLLPHLRNDWDTSEDALTPLPMEDEGLLPFHDASNRKDEESSSTGIQERVQSDKFLDHSQEEEKTEDAQDHDYFLDVIMEVLEEDTEQNIDGGPDYSLQGMGRGATRLSPESSANSPPTAPLASRLKSFKEENNDLLLEDFTHYSLDSGPMPVLGLGSARNPVVVGDKTIAPSSQELFLQEDAASSLSFEQRYVSTLRKLTESMEQSRRTRRRLINETRRIMQEVL